MKILQFLSLIFLVTTTNSLIAQPKSRTDFLGDPLPKGARVRFGTQRLWHGKMAISVAFSPDGKTLASGGWDNFLHLWEMPSGREIARLEGYGAAVWPMVFTSDGTRLAVGGQDGSVRLWDRKTEKVLHEFRGHTKGVYKLEWANREKTLISSSFDATIRFWDVETGKETRKIDQGEEVHGLSLSPDEGVLATSDNRGVIRYWDPKSGKEIEKFQAFQHGIDHLEFSPDGSILAAGSWESDAILFDAKTVKPIRKLQAGDKNTWPNCFSPDGKLIATGTKSGIIRLWNTETGKQLRVLQGHVNGVPMVTFSPNGEWLASASWDGRVMLWEVSSGKILAPKGHLGKVLAVHLSVNRSVAYTVGEDRTLRKWNAQSGKQLSSKLLCEEPLESVRISADGRRAVVVTEGDIEARCFDVASGKQVGEIRDGIPSRAPVALSSDGTKFAWAGRTRGIVVWDFGTGKVHREIREQLSRPSELALSQSGKLLAASDRSGNMVVWRLSDGSVPFRLTDHSRLTMLRFSPDEQTLLLVQSSNPILELWELRTGKLRARLDIQKLAYSAEGGSDARPSGRIEEVTWSNSGRLLAMELSSGTTLVLDLFLNKEVRISRPQERELYHLAISDDERSLAAAGADSTVLVWDLPQVGLSRLTNQQQRSLAECELAWIQLADEDAMKAQLGIVTLLTSRRMATELIRERLKPAKIGLSEEEANAWFQKLSDDRFQVRERATSHLLSFGRSILPLVEKELRVNKEIEARRRLHLIVEQLETWKPTGETLQQLRALEVLERLQTPAGNRWISRLAKGAPGALLTIEAREALERIEHSGR